MHFFHHFFAKLLFVRRITARQYWRILRTDGALSLLDEFVRAGFEEFQDTPVNLSLLDHYDTLFDQLNDTLKELFKFAWEHREQILQIALMIAAAA